MDKKIILFIALTLSACSYKPIYDPAVSTAKNDIFDDWQNCEFLIEKQTGSFDYGYNEVKYVSQCLINRGHSILNGE